MDFKRSSLTVLIIKINVLIYILWLVAITSGFVDPMAEHFLVSWDALEQGRWWTLLTSVFSHHLFFHLFLNLYIFYGFGSVVEDTLGTKEFLIFYLISGILSSLGHCLVSTFLLHDPQLKALGASGAIASVIILYSFLYPRERLLMMGIILVPAWMAVLMFIGLDLFGLYSQIRGGALPIGHGSHLSGALVGAIYYFFRIKRKQRIETHQGFL
jgi:membrane associated rhomboid family serine protease